MIVITGESLTLFLMPSKICVVLLRQLLNVVDETLCDEQAGFLHGRSNCDLLFMKHNIIEHCFQFQWPVMINFIDSQKSFGQHIQRVMVKTIRNYGIAHQYINIFWSLYLNFICCVRIDKDTKFFSIITEVQDCVLSQFLFLLIVNMYEKSHKLIELWNSIEK